MKNLFGSFSVIIILVASIVLLSAVFIVSETEQVIITQFGEPVGDPIKEPGLYFKIPVAQEAIFIEKRILVWDGDANRIPTKDKRYIWLDTTARWRIVDPLRFYQAVRNEEGAQQRLDAVLDGATRNVVAGKDLTEIIRSTNRILEVAKNSDDVEDQDNREFEIIPDDSGRINMSRQIFNAAKPKVENFGIELVDIMVKRVNYDHDVQMKVFERMISERQRVADRYRSEGQSEQARIEGLKEKEINRIESEAYREAQVLRGKADAEAIQIYANAYSNDEEFYAFLKTLDSYRETIGSDTTLMIGTDNEYFSYLKKTTTSK